MLKIFEGFAGYGGASFALKRLSEKNSTFKYKVVGYSEFDKFASELFDLNHPGIKNFGDITMVNPKDIPDFDMFTGGFPCQPFSTAGMQKGIDDPYGRGTLFEHIIRICEEKRPKYILMENVKGILSPKFNDTLERMEYLLKSIGYSKKGSKNKALQYAVLNSKDYGIPQNRVRVWMFARLGGLPENFSLEPKKTKHTPKLKDFLDPKEEIEERMYLSKKQIEHLKEKHNIRSFIVKEACCFDVYNKRIKKDGLSPTITLPEHNSLRVVEPSKTKEIVRKMTASEQFRLMGLESLSIIKNPPDIKFGEQSYTQLSKRAGNGWDVNLVTKLLDHIFEQLKSLDKFNY